MGVLMISVLLLVTSLCHVRAVEVIYGYEDPSNILNSNWDFEEDVSGSDWDMKQSTGTRVAGGYTGNYCLEVDRPGDVQQGGPYQTVTGLKANTNYYMSLHVKLPNPSTENSFITITTFYSAALTAGGVDKQKTGYLRYMLPSDEWWQLGGDFRTPDEAFGDVQMMVHVEPGNVVYQIDTFTLIELPSNSDVMQQTSDQIVQHRKNDVSLVGTLGSQISLPDTRVKFELVRHEFGFGTAIKGAKFLKTGASETAYREYMLGNFNWATLENWMKWKAMENTQGTRKLDRVDWILDKLEEHNITARGHNILWNMPQSNPNWVKELTGQALKDEILERVDYFTEHFKGRLAEVDVINEQLQRYWYEGATGDPDIIEEEFQHTRDGDPNVKACINDYLILRGGGWAASRQANLVKALLHKNVPIDCIGIQGHMRTLPFDPARAQKRLQIVSQAGLPLSITEMSFHDDDVNVRAEGLDTMYRLLFANPNVHSATVWGFSDQFGPFATDYAWTEGATMTPNAAGLAYENLIHNEWHTAEEFTPTSAAFTEGFSAFRGNYKLTVEENGVVILDKDIYVDSGDNHVQFTV